MQIFTGNALVRRLACALAGQLLIATVVHASEEPRNGAPSPSGWDVSLGGGLAVKPTYEGSDRYRLVPAPLLHVSWTWADWLSIGPDGLRVYWHENAFRVGAALAYDSGRRNGNGNGVFRQGDDRLNGLGNIGAALGVRVFTSYSLGRVTLSESVTRFTGGRNGGVLADTAISAPFRLSDRATLALHAAGSWENRKRMQEFFGVTPTQALSSIFPQFTAHAGVKDVTAGITFRYQLTRHLFVMASADAEKLRDDAARSPITFAATSGFGSIMLGYHF